MRLHFCCECGLMWSVRKLRRATFVAGSLTAALLLSGCGTTEEKADTVDSNEKEYLVYFGTYTGGESQGIYVSRFNAGTGEVTPPVLAAEATDPNFLAVHPSRRFLYAVSRTQGQGGQPIGTVISFAIDEVTGKLALLNEVSSGGPDPTHLNVDHTGRAVVVADYVGGCVSALPVDEDGRLGEASAFVQHTGSSVDPERQKSPHAHSVNFSPDNRFVVAADLGLDKLLVYRFDAEAGSLVANDPPFARVAPGAGARHFTFHPGGKFAYVINEQQSTVTVFAYAAERGALDELQTISTLPKDFAGTNSTAEVLAHPSGRFLYGSNRGHNSIAVFAVDSGNGTLTPVEHVSTQGERPRNFQIDPTGRYLFAANQSTDNVVVFRIAEETGRLSPTGQTLEIDSPVCVRFVALD